MPGTDPGEPEGDAATLTSGELGCEVSRLRFLQKLPRPPGVLTAGPWAHRGWRVSSSPIPAVSASRASHQLQTVQPTARHAQLWQHPRSGSLRTKDQGRAREFW